MKKFAALAVVLAGAALGGCAVVPAYEPAVMVRPAVVYAPPPVIVVRPGYGHRYHHHPRYGWRG